MMASSQREPMGRRNQNAGRKRHIPPNKKNNKFNIAIDTIDETKRIAFQQELESFAITEDPDLNFPASLSKNERAFVHQLAEQMGFKSRSHGRANNRALTISKSSQAQNTTHDDSVYFRLDDATNQKLAASNYDEVFDKAQLMHLHNTCKADVAVLRQMSGHPYSNTVSLPGPILSNNLQSVRVSLPIANYRSELVEAINDNQVVVIAGETGSGKTTQVSQYILEEFHMQRKPCRIICTQPRRLAAISIAERVAAERGEKVGQGVGYQVRLDSCITDNTNLILTTTGYFTRCLMGGSVDDVLSVITHVFLDEVHERDSHVDFLMITIRDALPRHPHLKVVLMSATMDTDIFGKYFNDCPVMKIPGRMFHVDKFYLEHILQFVQFPKSPEPSVKSSAPIVLSPENQAVVDKILRNCFIDSEEFEEFYVLVKDRNIPIDTHHSETEMTGLLIAVYHGDCSIIETLLLMGADVTCVGKGKNALQMAEFMEHDEAIDILKHHWDRKHEDGSMKDILTEDQTSRLRSYESVMDTENKVDLALVYELIAYIHSTLGEGSILVFLTGYTEILDMHELLEQSDSKFKLQLHMLHSRIKATDHRAVFVPARPGYRKIILSTNIAETSLTIDDVVYVIDTGKVKQKTFDAVSATTCLMSTWISKACAEQRAGRAGRTRPGVCFRLYTQKRYDAMEQFTIPEILRVPLTELCLQAKSIAADVNISDFLAKAIQPPPAISVNRSIKLLQTMEALTEDESLTYLGLRLSDIPLDPQLGKCLLFSIMFGCLDPVLTIVSALAAQEPFLLPTLPREKKRVSEIRREMAGDFYSDHYTLLRVYQLYNEKRAGTTERAWCKTNFISHGNMDTIDGIRSQLLLRLQSSGLIRKNLREHNRSSHSWALVKTCLAAGLYPNVCRVDKSSGVFRSGYEKKLTAAVGSVFHGKSPKEFQLIVRKCTAPWIVFLEKTRSMRNYLVRNNTGVSSMTIALVAGSSVGGTITQLEEMTEDGVPFLTDTALMQLDDWIALKGDINEIDQINQLRLNINLHFMKYVASPMEYFNSTRLSQLAENVAAVLYLNEVATHLRQPQNVGLVPLSYNSRQSGLNRSRAGVEQPNSSYSNNQRGEFVRVAHPSFPNYQVDFEMGNRRNNGNMSNAGNSQYFDNSRNVGNTPNDRWYRNNGGNNRNNGGNNRNVGNQNSGRGRNNRNDERGNGSRSGRGRVNNWRERPNRDGDGSGGGDRYYN